MVSPVLPELLDELRAVVGDQHVLTSDDMTEAYRIDWMGRYRADSAVVARPADTDEMVAVVRACARHGRPICPQGGNTGMVGASVPLGGEVVVSTKRLQRCSPVDERAGTVVVGAGVTLGELQRHAEAAGFEYGVDLGARDTATVGGTIATNAGGTHVIRRGMTRANCVGVEVVLADGSVVGDLAGLVKDNTGYHLPSLFCGSEGTLGIITAATMKLHRPLAERVTALVAFVDVDSATAAVGELALHHLPVDAIEFMIGDGVELVRSSFGLPAPFDAVHSAYLLVECSDDEPLEDRVGDALSRIPGVVDAAVASSQAQREALWKYRELHTESINLAGPPVKLDVTVPLGQLSEFIVDVERHVSASLPTAGVWLFGHAGDGNIHVNVTGVDPSDEGQCTELVLSLVTSLGGSVSAEHGIGRIKKGWLERQRGSADVAAFRAIKRSLDPEGLFQPDVLLP